MKIIVPIDFQETSFAAFSYATFLAKALEAQLTVLHVHPGNLSLETRLSYESDKERIERLTKRMKYFTTIYPNQQKVAIADVPIEYQVQFGIPGFTVADYANKQDYDLIIMGTRDNHFLLEDYVGSTSSITIDKSNCPVLLIHQNTLYQPVDKLAFAFDKKGDFHNPLRQFLKLNNLLKAKTDFIHVSNEKDAELEGAMNKILDQIFGSGEPVFSFEVKKLKGDQTMDAIKAYCLDHQCDMLALVHQKKGLLDYMLKHSMSIKMAQDFHLPVIIFK